MFIDDMFEDLLINKKMQYKDACAEVCNEKLKSKKDWNFTNIRRIENGYQGCVRKYPALNPRAFRYYVYIKAPQLCKDLGWSAEFEKEAGR